MFIEDVEINLADGVITDLFGDHPFNLDNTLWNHVRDRGLTSTQELNNEFLSVKKKAKRYLKALAKINSSEVSVSDVDLGELVLGNYFIKEPLTYQDFLLYKVLFLHTKAFVDYEELSKFHFNFGNESGTLIEIGTETLTFLIQSETSQSEVIVTKTSDAYFLLNYLRWFKAPKSTLTESLDWFDRVPSNYLGRSREWIMLMFDVQELLTFKN